MGRNRQRVCFRRWSLWRRRTWTRAQVSRCRKQGRRASWRCGRAESTWGLKLVPLRLLDDQHIQVEHAQEHSASQSGRHEGNAVLRPGTPARVVVLSDPARVVVLRLAVAPLPAPLAKQETEAPSSCRAGLGRTHPSSSGLGSCRVRRSNSAAMSLTPSSVSWLPAASPGRRLTLSCTSPPNATSRPPIRPPRHLQPASLNLLPQIIYALVVLHYLRFGGLLRSVTERDSRSLSYTVIAIPMINPAAPW